MSQKIFGYIYYNVLIVCICEPVRGTFTHRYFDQQRCDLHMDATTRWGLAGVSCHLPVRSADVTPCSVTSERVASRMLSIDIAFGTQLVDM